MIYMFPHNGTDKLGIVMDVSERAFSLKILGSLNGFFLFYFSTSPLILS